MDMKVPAGSHPALPWSVQPARGQSLSHNESFVTVAAYGFQGQEDLDVSYLSPHISQQDRTVEMSPLDSCLQSGLNISSTREYF